MKDRYYSIQRLRWRDGFFEPEVVIYQTTDPARIFRVFLKLLNAQHRYFPEQQYAIQYSIEPYPDVCLKCGHPKGRNVSCERCNKIRERRKPAA